jgi:ABC-type Zn2+ transport system substrate-binding protein/surface adhesin
MSLQGLNGRLGFKGYYDRVHVHVHDHKHEHKHKHKHKHEHEHEHKHDHEGHIEPKPLIFKVRPVL